MSVLERHNVRVVGSCAAGTQADEEEAGGGGRSVVVLAHGFGTDQSCWAHVVPHLSGEHDVVLLDLMGAGSTDPEAFCFQRYSSIQAHAEDLLGVLDALGVKQCSFVGHSMSCMIGVIASILRPALFRRLILIGGSPRYLNAEDYHGGFEQEDLDELFHAMETNFQDWVSGFAPLMMGADLESQLVKEFTRTFFCLRPDIALHTAKTVFGSDLRALLPQVSVPCHVIQSTSDAAVPLSVAHYMQKHLGSMSVVEILPTHGHLPHLSAPHLVVPAIKRHLAAQL